MAEIHGYYDPRFRNVAQLLAQNLATGADVGASVAVTLEGEMVVDLWGGWADAAQTKPWQADTITNVWSSTKTVTSLAALVLASRGRLDLDKPVAAYWDEFKVNGKENILIRQILSHTSGVSGWEQPVTITDLYDWEKSTQMLARQAPWWEPGTASGYHDRNFGHLIGEVIRRITGHQLGEFVAHEVADPLKADFQIGLDCADFPRIANVIPFTGPLPIDAVCDQPESIAYKTLSGPSWKPDVSWTDAWRKADIGAANGHGNARSLARLLSVIACGGTVSGITFLTPEICDRIFEEQSNGMDKVLGADLRFGIGYALKNQNIPYFPEGRVCGWGGWGGSVAMADRDRRISISYVMNRMEGGSGGDRGPKFVQAVYAALNGG